MGSCCPPFISSGSSGRSNITWTWRLYSTEAGQPAEGRQLWLILVISRRSDRHIVTVSASPPLRVDSPLRPN